MNYSSSHRIPLAKSLSAESAKKATLWIDLDNTPHVPFFRPIIKELERRGYTVVLTARDAFQVCELAQRFGLECQVIGRHYGKSRLMKVGGLAWRSLQLLPFALRNRPVLGVSHGSRAQILLCNLLRIPTVMIMDYEHAQTPPLVRPRWEIVPAVLMNSKLHCTNKHRIRTYPGIKEDVYAPEFQPDPALVDELQLSGAALVVTVRPPATEAHYHNPESDLLFQRFMERIVCTPDARTVLLPRNTAQQDQIRQQFPAWFTSGKVIVPRKAVDGLNLLWHSDLVVSGGGTMNREAAALGVPVYSIFRGKIGAVDRQLASEKRMILIENVDDVEKKIALQPRRKDLAADSRPREALKSIVEQIEDILGVERKR